jgi:predicted RNase H-like HicB family nuclease
MTSTELKLRAAKLADRPYAVKLTLERLRDGSVVYVASVRELMGCLAQGATRKEAIAELDEVLTEYIESILEDGLEVPEPAITRAQTRRRIKAATPTARPRVAPRTTLKGTTKSPLAA